MSFDMSCFGVITGVLGSTDLQVTHKGYHREREKTGCFFGWGGEGGLPGSDADSRKQMSNDEC